jgi:hypothetical protein
MRLRRAWGTLDKLVGGNRSNGLRFHLIGMISQPILII